MGRLDQGAVHPGEQGKAEKERQAGAPARRRQRSHAKSGGAVRPRCLSAEPLKAQRMGRLDQGAVHPGEQGKADSLFYLQTR